ncbi:MAG: flagellar hook assembly protein FlgD [Amylibacter sp.]|nr:flagellar hook assembly protein FlgD [Amylibacter sp.]
MEISSQTTQTGTPTVASEAQTQLGLDLDNFLILLTAQITNQDPLEPMDSTTFVSQLAQLSQVEQAITTNDNLERLGQQLASSNEFSDVQLIGREVVLASDKLDLSSGQAQIQYELSEEAQQVSINIIGLNGDVIKKITGLPEAAGVRQTVDWDGLSAAGLQVADGAYKFEIVAVNSELDPVSYQSFAVTHVEELAFRNGQPTLLLRNDQEVSSGVILAVR